MLRTVKGLTQGPRCAPYHVLCVDSVPSTRTGFCTHVRGSLCLRYHIAYAQHTTIQVSGACFIYPKLETEKGNLIMSQSENAAPKTRSDSAKKQAESKPIALVANAQALRDMRIRPSRFLFTVDKHGVDYDMYASLKVVTPDSDTVNLDHKYRVYSDLIIARDADSPAIRAIPVREYLKNPAQHFVGFTLVVERPVKADFGNTGVFANTSGKILAVKETYEVWSNGTDIFSDAPLPDKLLQSRVRNHTTKMGKTQQWKTIDMQVTNLKAIENHFNES